MNFHKQIWDVKINGVMNFDNIRRLYSDKGYRLRECHYSPGDKMGGIMRSGKWYIISGIGKVIFGTIQKLEAGQILEMPEGEYEVEAMGDLPLYYVVVWKLPPSFDKLKTIPNEERSWIKND